MSCGCGWCCCWHALGGKVTKSETIVFFSCLRVYQPETVCKHAQARTRTRTGRVGGDFPRPLALASSEHFSPIAIALMPLLWLWPFRQDLAVRVCCPRPLSGVFAVLCLSPFRPTTHPLFARQLFYAQKLIPCASSATFWGSNIHGVRRGRWLLLLPDRRKPALKPSGTSRRVERPCLAAPATLSGKGRNA